MIENLTPGRGAALAAQLTRATADLLAAAEACDVAQWQTRCANEERTVGVLVHHVAKNHTQICELLAVIVAGRPAPPISQAMIDHANARHAVEYAGVTQAETCTLLRATGATAVAYIGTLADADLARTTVIPVFGAAPVTAQQIVEYLLIGHSLGHLASIQAALLV